MKTTLVLLVLAAVAVNYSSAASLDRNKRQLVPSEFRNINIENYLKNQRAVLLQLKCIIYDGPCDRIGKYLKVTIPDLITGTCAHCTPSDRQTAGKLVAHIQKNFPKEWHDAVKKFQGGQAVKPEDASRIESLLGVKLDPELVAKKEEVKKEEVKKEEAVVETTVAPESAMSDAAPVPTETSITQA